MPEDNEQPWQEVVFGVTFGFGFFVLGTIIFLVVFRTWAANKQAQATLARDEAYRKLAESYDALLQRSTVAQQSTAAELTDLRGTVEKMERLMREIE